MATVVKRYIGSNGEILIPINQNDTNSANMISTRGTYFIAQTITPAVATLIHGGLLLAISYPTG